MAQKEHLVRWTCLKLINLGMPSTNFKVGVWFLEEKNGTAMAVLAVPAPTALYYNTEGRRHSYNWLKIPVYCIVEHVITCGGFKIFREVIHLHNFIILFLK